MASLRGHVAPVGRDGGDDDPIAGPEVPHFAADLLDDPDGLVPERKVLARPDRTMDRVGVGGADEQR